MGLFDRLFGGPQASAGPRKDPHQLVRDGALLLDVRTVAEFEGGALPGAVNIPVQELPRRLSEIDPHRPVVVYCRSGGRSAQAAGLLRGHGVAEVFDLGPISAW
jgi:rhodanese-related sulfurtransferase